MLAKASTDISQTSSTSSRYFGCEIPLLVNHSLGDVQELDLPL